MREAVGCSLLPRSCRVAERPDILPWRPSCCDTSSRVNEVVGVSYADVCSVIAHRSVGLEGLVMRRRRHWHMRRPGDADDGLLARDRPGCATRLRFT